MIKEIYIDNFKSLVGFKMEPAKFTCLIGLNGAGKSTILQALDFLSHLMVGNLDEWLAMRQWSTSDINSKLSKKSNIDFKVLIDDPDWGEITWEGSINRTKLGCTQESVKIGDELIILKIEDANCAIKKLNGLKNIQEVKDNIGTISNGKSTDRFPIVFEYQGSIISRLKKNQVSAPLLALKNQLLQLKSLELLSPFALRQRSRSSDRDIGLGGEKLSAFLHELTTKQKQNLEKQLKPLYPELQNYDTRALRAGWKELRITEKFTGYTLETEAKQVNDGMLRLMAILAQTLTEHSFLLFDEIENGINPELIKQLVDSLVKAPQQVMVTTHSPMILNYLEDPVAKSGVLMIYKTPEGHTQSTPFFEIPSMAEKLSVMGPGEVFVDTYLRELVDEIVAES